MNRVYPVSGRSMKDKVSLIGYALPTRDFTPWDDKEMDFWGCNERYNVGTFHLDKVTAWLQGHPYANCMRPGNPNDPKHPEWLQAKHDFPIFMHKHFDDIPSSVEYPLEQACRFIKRPAGYFSSAPAYMMVLAMMMGFKRIEMYGFQMESETEYFKQRPNFEYILGYGRALGFDIYLPPECTIARSELYGYRSLDTPFRQTLEFRRRSIDSGISRYMADFNTSRGRSLVVEELKVMTSEQIVALKWDEMLEKEKKDMEQHKQEINASQGALQECKYIIGEFDKHRAAEGAVDDEPKAE
jgi:hypothetical protein